MHSTYIVNTFASPNLKQKNNDDIISLRYSVLTYSCQHQQQQ